MKIKMKKRYAVVLATALPIVFTAEAFALGETVRDFTCERLEGRNISYTPATGRVQSGGIDNEKIGESSLTINRIYWEATPEKTELYVIKLTRGEDSSDEYSDIIFDKNPEAKEDIISVNDDKKSIYLRRTYKDNWYGFFTEYQLQEDSNQGDSLISFTTVLKCKRNDIK